MAASVRAPAHRALVSRLGVTWPEIARLELWRVLTSSLVQDDRGIVWPIVALLAALPLAERRFGSAPALATYFAVDIVSTVPVLAVLALAGASRLAGTPNVGASAGLVGLLAATIAARRGRTRAAAAAAGVAVLAVLLALDWELASVQHAIAAVAGAGAGVRLQRTRTVRPRRSAR
jgi:membrane associated rhomboid family serine protease